MSRLTKDFTSDRGRFPPRFHVNEGRLAIENMMESHFAIYAETQLYDVVFVGSDSSLLTHNLGKRTLSPLMVTVRFLLVSFSTVLLAFVLRLAY